MVSDVCLLDIHGFPWWFAMLVPPLRLVPLVRETLAKHMVINNEKLFVHMIVDEMSRVPLVSVHMNVDEMI